MSFARDILGVLRGLQLIAEAGLKLQRSTVEQIWTHSSLRPILRDCLSQSPSLSKVDPKNVAGTVADSVDRMATVFHGVQQYTSNATARPDDFFQNLSNATEELKLETEDSDFEVKLTESDKELLKKLDMEHQGKLKKLQTEHEEKLKKVGDKETGEATQPTVTAVPNPKSKQKLSASSKQRKVPSSQIGRIVSFGGLAAGLGIGTAAEYVRRTLGFGDASSEQSTLFLSQGNLDRIVDTLCKLRGAALKLGQVMSIQDESIVNPQLAKALERVRKSADFMPNWQVEEVMSAELGPKWRDNFVEFKEKPFAAASIGQVHRGTLKNGKEVAVKIQYPGVAKGIESDIDNLGAIMKLWNVFPKGMFLDNLMKVAKRELAWEVDYEREAQCTRRFKELVAPYPVYHVPEVIDELSTKRVFTTELLNGIPVDECFELEKKDRQFIAEKVMELTLLEVLEFRFMQTDPNWANFLYDPKEKQLLLLDFGASREYSKEFMDRYVQILKAACDADRATVLSVSKELGFLTGYESKLMEEAHVDAVMILGEVFRCPEGYDFAAQDMTARIQNLVPTMVTHRLCPPPEEVYSLHRKLSGIFLLCTKLKASISCRDKFLMLYNKYVGGGS